MWRAINFTWMYLSTLSLWFATWLAVFYCVKITSFNQPLFLWLKLRFSGLLPWLILGSLLVSLATSLPSVNFFTLTNKFATSSPYLIWLCIMILGGYPSGHSVILILSNPKLKEAALKGLHNARCLQEDESQ
ncbi:taste receptor type 2 member 1-like [Alligator mississippiensis]|uniref:taste receptor type 2 member 1-like n=1 Tax=Alligator mississippiensis TaxID=8496 RepID=UPI002877D847|nr:taste receptor type 2 member 1-like [Alligator mississippiensis]